MYNTKVAIYGSKIKKSGFNIQHCACRSTKHGQRRGRGFWFSKWTWIMLSVIGYSLDTTSYFYVNRYTLSNSFNFVFFIFTFTFYVRLGIRSIGVTFSNWLTKFIIAHPENFKNLDTLLNFKASSKEKDNHMHNLHI